MTTSRYLLVGLVSVGVSLGAGLLWAQPDDADGDDAGGDVTVPMQKRAEISPAEMRERSGELVDEMRRYMADVTELQSKARGEKEKDVIKINCINHHAREIRKLLEIADEAVGKLNEALDKGDEEERYHQFNRLTLVSEEVSRLSRAAQGCVGEKELTFVGPTQVEVDTPDVPDDPTDDPFLEVDIERPNTASPFT